MNDELKDILSNSNKDIDNQKLMDYLSRKLSKQESHDLEKLMADDDFVNDAVEGLEQFSNKKDLSAFTGQLNRKLLQQVQKKKNRKEKRKLKEQPWIYFAIILFLVLIIVGYVIIKKNMDSRNVPVNKGPQSQVIHGSGKT